MAEGNPPIDMQQQIMQLMAQVTALVQAQADRAAEPPQPRVREPDVKAPDTFHGTRSKLQAFLTECDMVFRLQPQRFPLESTKVDYMVALLRDSPLLAVRPYLEKDPRPDEISSIVAFRTWLKANFGDPDEDGTARLKLASLKQVTSASEYLVEVRGCLAVLGWPEDGLVVDNAIRGLKEHIQQELVRHKRPKTLSELCDIVVPFDNQWHEYNKGKKSEPASKKDASKKSSNDGPNIVPSSTPTSTTSTISSSTTSQPRPHLTQEQRDARRANNECLYCGTQGHFIDNCPNRRSKTPSSTPTVKTEPASGEARGPSS